MKLREAGHTMLYTVVFIPIVLGGAALAFDVSGLNLRAERLQSALDTITLDAAHSLPDIELTKSRVFLKIHQLGEELFDAKVEVDFYHSRISTSVTISDSKPILPRLLNAVGIKTEPQLQSLKSEAELLPIDAAIILSDGVDERPWQQTPNKTPWSEIRGLGMASSALTSCLNNPTERYSNFDLTQVWTDSKEWLTQSCYNPVFSNIKLSAMNISGSVLSVGSNRVAVVFTPGSNGLGEIVRHVALDPFQDSIFGGYSKPGEVPKAAWFPSKDLEYELGDEACIVFSDPTTAPQREYSLDRITRTDSNQRGCLTPVTNPMCGQPFSIGSVDRLNFDCLKGSSLSEAIYWRSAKRPANNINAAPDIYSALGLALSEVVPNVAKSNLDVEIRGNLADVPGKVIIVLTSILPKFDLANSAIQGLLETDTTLLIGFLNRSEYPSELVDTVEQAARVIEWQNFLSGMERKSRIPSALLVANSPDELTQNIAPKIISSTRKALLRK